MDGQPKREREIGGEDPVSPTEAARARRRDRDADARSRAGMRTGLAKQFKQVLDAQVRRAGDDSPAPKSRPSSKPKPPTKGRHKGSPKGQA